MSDGVEVEIDKIPWDLFAFERFTPDVPGGRTHERYLRGFLLEEHGRYQEALQWYCSLGRGPEDRIYLPAKHYRMGGIHEKIGEPDKAIEHYTRFVDLWNDCDPEYRHLLHEVEGRLERLREGTG